MKSRKILALVGTAVVLVGMLAIAPAVEAHTNVKGSNPADGATVDALPTDVWVQFGSAQLPMQPGAIQDGYLEVYDSCGNQVDEADSAVNETQDRIDITATQGSTGRYEIHWHVTAMDGAEQAGVIDFIVGDGAPCKSIKLTDASKDIDLGLDLTGLKSKSSAKATKVDLTFAGKPSCKALAGQELSMLIDSDFDGAANMTGDFVCKGKKMSLVVSEGEGDDATVLATFKVKAKGKTLKVKMPAKKFPADAHLDVHVESLVDSEDCDAETSCFDRVPDLGEVRVK